MWPSRRVLPSNPRYSAGARASSSATLGAPSIPRTSAVIRCTRLGPRGVNGATGSSIPSQAARDRAPLLLPRGEAAVEDPRLLVTVCPELHHTRAAYSDMVSS